jgi:hypothetical protein
MLADRSLLPAVLLENVLSLRADMNTFMLTSMFRQDAVEATLCADVPRLSHGVQPMTAINVSRDRRAWLHHSERSKHSTPLLLLQRTGRH